MKARNVIVAIFAAATIGIVGLVVASRTEVSPGSINEPMTASVRLSGSFDVSFAGEMIAARAGLFAAEKLQIELVPGSSQSDPVITVGSGKDAIGVASADRFLMARARGLPLVAFAADYLEIPIAFYALRSTGIRDPRDFVGKRVGYQPGTDAALIYAAMMDKLQLSRSNVQEIATAQDVSQLTHDVVEVLPGDIWRPSYFLERQNIDYNMIRPADYGIHIPGAVYFATEKTLKDHPRLIRRFLIAILRGWTFAYQNYSKSVAIIKSFDAERLTPDFIRFSLDQGREYLRPFGTRFCEFDKDQWRSLQDILLQQRVLKEPIDLTSAVTFDFLRDAYRQSNFRD